MSFEVVYLAAKKQNLPLLTKAITADSINVYKTGTDQLSPIEQLAFEGDIPAVEFLLEYDGSLNFAAQGAARAGNFSYVEDLLNRGADISATAFGAARGGYRAQAEDYIQRGAQFPVVAWGAARGGYFSYAEELLLGYADFHVLAFGAAARGGYRREPGHYHAGPYDSGLARPHPIPQFSLVAFGAARDETFGYTLRTIFPRDETIDVLAFGAAMGGHHTKVEEYLAKGADINIVLEGAAMAGNVQYVEELLSGGGRHSDTALRGAATAGLFDYMDVFLGKRHSDLRYACTGAATGGHYYYLNKILKFASYGKSEFLSKRHTFPYQHTAKVISHCMHSSLLADAAKAAARNWDCKYLADLVSRGADIPINIIGSKIVNDPEQQLRFLSHFPPEFIPGIIINIDQATQISIHGDLGKRAIMISNAMRIKKLPYSLALAKTEPRCWGMLVILTSLTMNPNSPYAERLPSELWFHIFNSLMPRKMPARQLNNLGFFCGRQLLEKDPPQTNYSITEKTSPQYTAARSNFYGRE